VVLLLLAGLAAAGCSTGRDAHPARGDDVTRPSPTASAAESSLPSFDPSTKVGDYAPGFPLGLLAAPDDAVVLASSAVPQDDGMVEVSLNLATTLPTEQVVDSFAERLQEAGFDAADPDDLSSSELAAFSAFTRTKGTKNPRFESVHLGVLDEGEERLVTLSGVVRAAE
jgi:hypothetical protein